MKSIAFDPRAKTAKGTDINIDRDAILVTCHISVGSNEGSVFLAKVAFQSPKRNLGN